MRMIIPRNRLSSGMREVMALPEPSQVSSAFAVVCHTIALTGTRSGKVGWSVFTPSRSYHPGIRYFAARLTPPGSPATFQVLGARFSNRSDKRFVRSCFANSRCAIPCPALGAGGCFVARWRQYRRAALFGRSPSLSFSAKANGRYYRRPENTGDF